jgi:peroxiredoxin
MRLELVAAAGLALFTLASPAHAEETLATEGQPAPPFRLPTYNPEVAGPGMVGINRYVGPEATEPGVKAVLVSFMASFCEPCKKELPYLEHLQTRYKADGLRVVLVSIDTETAGQEKVASLIAEHHVSFPVLKDRLRLVARRWLGSQSPLPSVFLVRADGTVAKVHRGYSEDASALLATEVEQALGLPPTPAPAAKPAAAPVSHPRHKRAAARHH